MGTLGVLHSNTLTLDGSQRRAIRRYRDHPALALWILWNKPYNGVVPPGRPNPTRSGELRALWAGCWPSATAETSAGSTGARRPPERHQPAAV